MQAGAIGAIDSSVADGLQKVQEKPLRYTEIPRLLTGIVMTPVPVTVEALDQLASALMAIDSHTGQSSAIADSIVFQNVTANIFVKSKLRSLSKTKESQELFPTEYILDQEKHLCHNFNYR